MRQVDAAGNNGAAASLSFTLDTHAPAAPTVALASDTGSSSSDHITSNGALTVTPAEAGGALQYSINGGTTWTSSFTAAEGANTVQVRQVDAAGNNGAAASLSFTLDTHAPAALVAITAIADDTGASSSDFITADTTLIVSGSNGALGAGEKVQISSDGGTTWFDVAQNTGTTWSYDDTANPHLSNVTYQVRVIDAANNVGNTASQLVTIDAAPTIDLAPIITEVPIPNPLPLGTDALAVHEVAPSMSEDGRWVVFFSDEQNPDNNNSNNSNNGSPDKGDVFLYDRLTGVTKVLTDYAHIPLASRPQDGTPEHYSGFSISGDGSTVVFKGEHEVPDPNFPNGQRDVSHIYVYDRPSDTVHLLTNPNNNNAPFTVNDEARIAGGQIVFSSTDFGNDNGPPTLHIYVTDLAGHIQTDITPGTVGITEPSDPSQPQTNFQQPDISGNGRYLTFWTVANTFDPVTNTSTPVGDATLYTYDRATGQHQVIATSSGSDGDNWWASMSNDGRYVVFQSDSDALDSQVGGVANGHTDIFVFDRQANGGHGGIIGVTDNASVHADGASFRASISANGGDIIFASDATNLVPGDTNGHGDTFVYDVPSNTFKRVSVASDGTQGDGDSTLGADISHGGTFQGAFVAFGSTAGNLVTPNDTDNGQSDVFVVDRTGGIFGAVMEDDTTPAFAGAPAGTLSTHGAFNFSDVNLTDTHTVHVIGNPVITNAPPGFVVPQSGLGTFTPSLVDTGGTGHGQVAWTFTVDNSLVQTLNGGQQINQVYTVQIDDGHGGVVSQNVTIAIFGTPDVGYSWGSVKFPEQPVTGAHIYSPFVAVNQRQGVAAELYGVTPSNYNPNGPDDISLYARGLDPFLLGTSQDTLVINTTIQQFPSSSSLVLPDTGPTSVEGIAIYETQDNNGNRFLNEAFITDNNNTLNVGGATQITGPLLYPTENPLFMQFRESSGVLSSYGVTFDQYDQATGTYTINLETFVHISGDPNYGTSSDFTASGVITALTFNGLTGGRTTLPASFFNSAGPNNGYLLAYAENNAPHSGQDYIEFLSYNPNGTPNLNFGPGNQGFFEIAPNLLAYGQHIAGDTTVHNQITLEATNSTHTGSPTSLLFIQPGGSGPIFAAWNETVTVNGDPNTYDQVEFVRHDANASVVNSYFTYQIADGQAQNIKLQSHNYSGVLGTGTMVELAYGDGTFTTIVEYFYNTTSGTTTQIGTYTEATPDGQTYSNIRDLGDGRVAIIYDDQLDSAGTTQVTTNIVDFRTTGLVINDSSITDGLDKYFAGTQFNDSVVGENSVNNFYYYIGRTTTVGPGPTDTFTGGNNGFNVAILPDAKSNYTFATNGATTTLTAIAGDTQHQGSLSVNNVQLLAFAPTHEPSLNNGVLEAYGGLFRSDRIIHRLRAYR